MRRISALLIAFILSIPVFSLSEESQHTEHLELYHEYVRIINDAGIVTEKDFSIFCMDDYEGHMMISHVPVKGLRYDAFYENGRYINASIYIEDDSYASNQIDKLMMLFVRLVNDESVTEDVASEIVLTLFSTLKNDGNKTVWESRLETESVKYELCRFIQTVVPSSYALFVDIID